MVDALDGAVNVAVVARFKAAVAGEAETGTAFELHAGNVDTRRSELDKPTVGIASADPHTRQATATCGVRVE
jgi:hypothetical protein